MNLKGIKNRNEYEIDSVLTRDRKLGSTLGPGENCRLILNGGI